MQFFNPNAFLLLWVLPLLLGVFMLANRAWEKRLERFGNLQTLQSKLMPGYRNTRRIRPFYLVLVFLFAIMALARPQWGEEKKKVERKGVNIIFLLDTSLSMLAEDVKPNRLEKSKLEIKSFIRRLKGDRIGMVAFSGSGFLQSPLTLDYSAFLLFLDAVKTGYIPDPGTSLNRAVRLAIRSFPEKEMKYKSLILFTDGEDHEGGMEQSVEEAKKAGVRIYTIGVGTAEGAPIPLRDEKGQKGGFKKNREGQVVITKLNKPLLEKIAPETGGLYLPSTPGEQEIDVVLKHLAGLGQKQFQEKMIAEKEDHFQFFLFLAIFFLAAEMLIRQKKATARRTTPPLLLAAFLLFSGFLESPNDLNEKGNQQFKEKKYQSALESYRKAGIKKPDDPAIQYNLASTLYKVNEYQEASQSLEKSIGETNKDPALRAQALYNYGNTQYRLGNFEKAIEAYQKALEINPKDVDAKYNLEFLQKEKSEFEKKNQERNKDQQQQQKNQQQDQQQNQQQQQQNQDQEQNQQRNQQEQQQEQQNQNQDQSGDQGQEQEEKNQSQQKEDQQDKESQSEQQKDQKEKQNQEPQEKQGEEEKPEEGQEKQEQQEQKQKGQEQEPEEQGGGQEDEQPSEGDKDQQKAPRPLQGQMTMENALRILDAMKESEKDLQDLRRPPINNEQSQVAKDW